MAWRGGISSSFGLNGTTSVVACICTAIAGRMTVARNGIMRRASSASTTRGSAEASSASMAVMKSGVAMARLLIAAWKSSCFESKWRRIAAGVTSISAAISARVVAAKPRVLKLRRAAARI